MPDPSPSTNPAPRPCPPQLDKGQELLDKQLPVYDGGFWALLILVTSAVLIPLSVARARNGGAGSRCRGRGAGPGPAWAPRTGPRVSAPLARGRPG